VIHGFTGTPSGIERVIDLTDVANAAGITVAYPQGTEVGPGGFGWNSGAAVFATTGVDDAAAISEMIDTIVATGCVDRGAITITGESNGAGMALAALCSPGLGGAFRSAVMVIPAIDAGVLERCAGNGAPDTPLAVAVGLIDTTAPVDGGNGLLPQRAWFDEVATWRGCSGVDERGALTSLVDHAAGANCRRCTEIFTVADGPHTWPGTRVGNGGSTPGTFDLNRRIVANVIAPVAGCLSAR
jgi:polyhydroxybutyrate depolymerase